MCDGRHDDHKAVRRRRSQEAARSRGSQRCAVGPANAQWWRDVRAGRARMFLARQPLQGGLRGAPSVGQDAGGPPACSTSASMRPARRAVVRRVVVRAPADLPGRPVSGGSLSGAGGAYAPALASGVGAPRAPPGLAGSRRPSGVAGCGPELSALAVPGADLLAENEGGGARRQVGGELRKDYWPGAGMAMPAMFLICFLIPRYYLDVFIRTEQYLDQSDRVRHMELLQSSRFP